MNKGPFLPRRHRDNPIIREYERAVERGDHLLRQSYHVIPAQGGWTVKQSGTSRGRIFDTQADAINAGKRIAKQRGITPA